MARTSKYKNEERAVELMGKDRILSMTTLVQEFDIALCTALEENE